MTVNGLKLPHSLVALIDRAKPSDYWVPKDNSNQFPLLEQEHVDVDDEESLDDLLLCKNPGEIEKETNRLPVAFHLGGVIAEDVAGWNAKWSHLPGWIPFITDFSQIVYFGETPCAEAYCLDYRENPEEPSIIHWDDAYWRRVAPNFDSFIGLFEPLPSSHKS